MTREEQRQLLTIFFDQVRDALLEKADQWPDEWDGFELRWLARKAIDWETERTWKTAPISRKREFNNDWVTLDLY